jgi:hypothetical protein
LRALLHSVALACALAGSAAAEEITVLTSKAPYWKVGPRDDKLSRACSLGRFNQRRPGSLVARFVGKEGYGVLGVAKGNGVNLLDPDRKAKPREDYFFIDHGTTNCKVLVGGRKGKPAG